MVYSGSVVLFEYNPFTYYIFQCDIKELKKENISNHLQAFGTKVVYDFKDALKLAIEIYKKEKYCPNGIHIIDNIKKITFLNEDKDNDNSIVLVKPTPFSYHIFKANTKRLDKETLGSLAYDSTVKKAYDYDEAIEIVVELYKNEKYCSKGIHILENLMIENK